MRQLTTSRNAPFGEDEKEAMEESGRREVRVELADARHKHRPCDTAEVAERIRVYAFVCGRATQSTFMYIVLVHIDSGASKSIFLIIDKSDSIIFLRHQTYD